MWFVGYTPNLATAAMIAGANQEGQPIPLAGQTVVAAYHHDASGSGIAGPMWGDAMRAIEQWPPTRPSPRRDLSALGGRRDDRAEQWPGSPVEGSASSRPGGRRLQRAGPSRRPTPSTRKGTVAYTDPGSGAVGVRPGAVVSIYPSTGFVPAPQPSNPGGNGNGNRAVAAAT